MGAKMAENPLGTAPKPHIVKKISFGRLLRVHLEIYEYERCDQVNICVSE